MGVTCCCLVDRLPTLCGLAGAAPGGDLQWDGQDIWPLLAGECQELPARTIYSVAPGFRARMVRRGDWKLVVTDGGGSGKKSKPAAQVELFNLVEDPGETKNLAGERPEVLAAMRQRLAEIAARDKDAVVQD